MKHSIPICTLTVLTLMPLAGATPGPSQVHATSRAADSWTCPVCDTTIRGLPGDDRRLVGFLERVKAHANACPDELDVLREIEAAADRLALDETALTSALTEHDNDQAVHDRAVAEWDHRMGDYEVDVKVHNTWVDNLNDRIEAFDAHYRGVRELPPAEYQRYISRRRSLEAESRQAHASARRLEGRAEVLDEEDAQLDQEEQRLLAEKAALEERAQELDDRAAQLMARIRSLGGE